MGSTAIMMMLAKPVTYNGAVKRIKIIKLMLFSHLQQQLEKIFFHPLVPKLRFDNFYRFLAIFTGPLASKTHYFWVY